MIPLLAIVLFPTTTQATRDEEEYKATTLHFVQPNIVVGRLRQKDDENTSFAHNNTLCESETSWAVTNASHIFPLPNHILVSQHCFAEKGVWRIIIMPTLSLFSRNAQKISTVL